MEAAFAGYAYVPYTALSKAARQKGLRAQETMLISEGGLVARGLGHSDEHCYDTLFTFTFTLNI